jgi:hypothetical protein
MACQHKWDVDRCNVETCTLCGKVHNCQPGIDKSLNLAGLERPLRKGVYLDRFFDTKSDYPVQGGLSFDLYRQIR